MNVSDVKKIIFLDQYNKIGGGQTILVNLVKFCIQAGYEVEVWIPQGSYIQSKLNHFNHQIKYKEIQIPQLNNSSKNILDLIRFTWFSISFTKYIKDLKRVDKIYINGPRLALAAIITSFFTQNDYYYHLHLVHSQLEKIIFNIAQNLTSTKKILLGSEFISQNYYHSHLILKNQVKTEVFSGFLSQEYHHLDFENRFAEKVTGYNIMLHGRISPEKGQDIFINLAHDFSVHDFYIIGSPSNLSYYNTLRKMAPANIFFDQTQNIPRLVKDLKIHFSISPSVWDEPFGLTPIEAMACSCISFVSAKGNYINTSKDTNAILFTDYQDLKNKFIHILSQEKQELAKIAQEQYQKTMKKYNIQTRARQFMKILEN